MKKRIENLLKQTIKKLYPIFKTFEKEGIDFLVEIPKEKMHGDYSTNIALALSKKLGKNPLEVAHAITKELSSKVLKNIGIQKTEAVAPGFINFYLSKEIFVENIKQALKDKSFGKNQSLKNKKVIVEYTDPNILKEFHVGHLMSNAIGESIARIFEFQGVKLKRVNYQGDVGLHVAKAIWGKLKNPDMAWAKAYAFGAAKYEEDEAAQKEVVEINKKVFEKSDKEINALYNQGRKDSLAYFDTIYKKLGTDFDRLFFESEVADTGKKIVMDNVGKVFERGDKGAIVFKGENVSLHTRVFVNSQGLSTYEAKDLALPELKYKYFKYDNSIIITAHEQNAYFDVMLAALAKIKPELAGKTKHIGHGMLRLPEGKMSSRTGKVVTAESLIEKVKERVAQKAADKNLDEATIQIIAIGAIKYSILKQSIGSDIIYDFEKSVSFEGDSGPYLQYAYVRAASILQKAKSERIKPSLKKVPAEITQLEKMMRRFPEVVETSAQAYEPHLITLYLTELAREFNNYYANHKIVDKADEFSPYKVALTQAFSVIMKNGLWLLGILAPEKM